MIISFKAEVIWRNEQINGGAEHYVGCKTELQQWNNGTTPKTKVLIRQ